MWGRELYVDATKVDANADLDSLVPRFSYDATTHLADLFENGTSEEALPANTELRLGILPLPIGPEQ